MSFHSIHLSAQPIAFSKVARLILPLVITALVVTTTGCSMVMGILGTSESDVTGVEAVPTRLLQPTPSGQQPVSAAARELRNGPTPTPFVMRPVTQMAPVVSHSDGSVLPTAAESRPSQIRVVIQGDSVNLRSAPGLDSQVLATKPRDTAFDYVDETAAGDWIQICCVDSQLAWVYAELVTKESAPSTASGVSTLAQASPGQATVGAPVVNDVAANSTTFASDSSTVADMQRLAQGLTNGNGAITIALTPSGEPTTYRSTEDGYAITLPSTWLPLANSSGVIQSSIDAVASANPAMATLLNDQLAQLNDIPISLIAFDLAPETLQSGFATNLNLMKQPVPAGFALDYLVQFSASQLEHILGLSDAAESTHLTLPAGEAVVLDYQLGNQTIARQYYLLHDQALYIITFSASASLAGFPVDLFNEVMQSFAFQEQ